MAFCVAGFTSYFFNLIFTAMKKNYWVFLFLFSFAFVSCEDDNDVVLDTVKPNVTITNPAPNAVFAAGGEFELTADITDNEGLEEVRVFVTGPDGTRISQFDEEIIDFLNDNRNYDLQVDYILPATATTGTYTITVEAEDEAGNIAQNTVTITVNEADLDAAAFNTAFASTEWFETWDADDDGLLNEDEFGISFFDAWDLDDNDEIVETEWNDFAADFGLDDETWSVWDADADGVLSEDELNTGLGNLNFFTDWDLDDDELLDEEEYTGGIFGFWDDNDDDLLTSDEYVERFDIYYGI